MSRAGEGTAWHRVEGMVNERPFGAEDGVADSGQRVRIDPRFHDAVLFDVDGVITDTASLHAKSWAQMFDEYLRTRPPAEAENHDPFTPADYRHFIDGKPRYDGVRDFLTSRGVSLPWGHVTDPATAETVCGLGNRKQELFITEIAAGVPVFESTVALIRRLIDTGVRVAAFSASRNCARVLESAGVADLVEVRVDGVVADELDLPGKPDPAMLLEAARRLGVRPGRAVVVEDSEAGVTAGRAGGFGLVIGVDRTGEAGARLRECGADMVVGAREGAHDVIGEAVTRDDVVVGHSIALARAALGAQQVGRHARADGHLRTGLRDLAEHHHAAAERADALDRTRELALEDGAARLVRLQLGRGVQ